MFDVNAISPGTEFMTELNAKLDYFIKHKVNTDPLYAKVRNHFFIRINRFICASYSYGIIFCI